MKEVIHELFFKAMTGLNVHPEIIGRWPYTSIFRMQDMSRREVGRIETGEHGKNNRYFLIEA